MSNFENAHEEAKAGMAEHMAEQKAEHEKALDRKVLHHTKWLEMVEKDGYIFMSSPWCNGHGVAVLPYRLSEGDDIEIEYLVMMEKRPCHGDTLMPYSLTGGCDKEGEAPVATAVREVAEESGYIVAVEDMIDLGNIRESKASDMTTHAFAVEITDDTVLQKPEGDGSAGEAEAYPIWLSEREAVWHSNDPVIAHMIARLRIKDRPKKNSLI